MSRKTPPFEHWEAWTTARFFGFLRSGLRAKFNRYPVKYAALEAAKSSVKTGVYKSGAKKGRPKFESRYECARCKGSFRNKDVQVDHITPAGSLKDWHDIELFCRNLFCGTEGLQVLCAPCHKIKTQEDKE